MAAYTSILPSEGRGMNWMNGIELIRLTHICHRLQNERGSDVLSIIYTDTILHKWKIWGGGCIYQHTAIGCTACCIGFHKPSSTGWEGLQCTLNYLYCFDLGCSWGERKLANTVGYRGTTGTWNEGGVILKLRYGPQHGSLIALVVRGVSVSCRKPSETEGLFDGWGWRAEPYWNRERRWSISCRTPSIVVLKLARGSVLVAVDFNWINTTI